MTRRLSQVALFSTLGPQDIRWIDQVADQFDAAWREGRQPKIAEFLGDAAQQRRHGLLLELVQVDLEYRWTGGQRCLIESYLTEWPELNNDLSDLGVLLRFEPSLRKSHGNEPKLEQLVQRFPHVDRARLLAEIGADAETKLAVPSKIGPYPIERRLGGGGFGTVWLGHDEQMDRPVAIKVPGERLLSSQKAREEFLREARSVARLRHPHIVTAYAFGGEADEKCYIVYEFIDGTSLAERLKQGRIPHVESARWLASIADALQYAHLQGLVHRDIKPANILLDKAGRPFLADFGLAVREEGLAAERGRLAGTKEYMAPEQVRREGHRVGSWTDIYALGAVFYEMLCGRRPFQAPSVSELFDQIQFAEPRRPRTIDDSIPKELERICLKALAKKAAERYTTASDMAEELRLAVADMAGSPGRGASPSPPTSPSPDSRPGLGAAQDEAVSAIIVDDAGPPSPMPTPAGTPGPTAPDSDLPPIRIVPKGLRSFDENDKDFFLELLPGPRDRDGLPDSIRFWKTRMERCDGDDLFAVGLIYGPSGCGKSSLMRAGLLPRLAENVLAIYVESTRDDTEARLIKALRRACPQVLSDPSGSQPSTLDSQLSDLIAALRRGTGLPDGRKVVIVLDQFEQWLHAHAVEPEQTELVAALRQADGQRVQVVLMVRDDFWLAVSRLFQELEVPLVEGRNVRLVDLFDPRHARRVLQLFGQAYGCLPEHATEFSAEQQAFLEQAVEGLSEAVLFFRWLTKEAGLTEDDQCYDDAEKLPKGPAEEAPAKLTATRTSFLRRVAR